MSAYAQRLLDGLETVDWTDSLKETQRNWIGRSEGTEVRFKVKDSDLEFTIFTTRADTMFGVTFMVLAPESELVPMLTTEAQRAEVEAYLDRTKKRTERERIADRRKNNLNIIFSAQLYHFFNILTFALCNKAFVPAKYRCLCFRRIF